MYRVDGQRRRGKKYNMNVKERGKKEINKKALFVLTRKCQKINFFRYFIGSLH